MKTAMTVAVAFAAGLSVLALPVTAASKDDALLKRGEYLVNGPVACGNCHNTRAPDFSFVPGKEFAGGFRIAVPDFDVYAANITPDKDTGIGSWTDAQIMRAIRRGINKNGEVIFPPMPTSTYNNMSNYDVRAIVAYLRTVKPVSNVVPESKWNIPQQPMPPPKGAAAPNPTDKVAYGRYIVTALAHCFECHSSPDAHGAPDIADHMGGGGFRIPLAADTIVLSGNITPDPETGIGKWSDDDIKKAITDGVTPTGGHLSPPMPYPFFKNMTPQDLDAVVAYIRTIPSIKNKVERTDFQKKKFP